MKAQYGHFPAFEVLVEERGAGEFRNRKALVEHDWTKPVGEGFKRESVCWLECSSNLNKIINIVVKISNANRESNAIRMIFEYDHYPIARQATFREQQSGIVRREEAIEVVNGEYDERPMTVKRLIKVSRRGLVKEGMEVPDERREYLGNLKVTLHRGGFMEEPHAEWFYREKIGTDPFGRVYERKGRDILKSKMFYQHHDEPNRTYVFKFATKQQLSDLGIISFPIRSSATPESLFGAEEDNGSSFSSPIAGTSRGGTRESTSEGTPRRGFARVTKRHRPERPAPPIWSREPLFMSAESDEEEEDSREEEDDVFVVPQDSPLYVRNKRGRAPRPTSSSSPATSLRSSTVSHSPAGFGSYRNLDELFGSATVKPYPLIRSSPALPSPVRSLPSSPPHTPDLVALDNTLVASPAGLYVEINEECDDPAFEPQPISRSHATPSKNANGTTKSTSPLTPDVQSSDVTLVNAPEDVSLSGRYRNINDIFAGASVKPYPVVRSDPSEQEPGRLPTASPSPHTIDLVSSGDHVVSLFADTRSHSEIDSPRAIVERFDLVPMPVKHHMRGDMIVIDDSDEEAEVEHLAG